VRRGDIDVVVTNGDVRHDFEIVRRFEHGGVHWICKDTDEALLSLQALR
jgi:hypothetical protein